MTKKELIERLKELSSHFHRDIVPSGEYLLDLGREQALAEAAEELDAIIDAADV